MWTGGIYWLSSKKSIKSIKEKSFCGDNIVPAFNESGIAGWQFYYFISPILLSEQSMPTVDSIRTGIPNTKGLIDKGYAYRFYMRVYDDKILLATELTAVLKELKKVEGLKQLLSKHNSVQYRIDSFVKKYFEYYKKNLSDIESNKRHELLQLKLNYTDAKVSTFGEKVENIALSGEDVVTSSVFENTLPDSFYNQVGLSIISEASDKFRIKENGTISYHFRGKTTYKRIQKILYLFRHHDFIVPR